MNTPPTASFTQQSSKFNTNLGVAGTTLFSGSITESEGDVPYSASLSGTDAALFEIVYNNSDSSSNFFDSLRKALIASSKNTLSFTLNFLTIVLLYYILHQIALPFPV